jgi:elongation factor G
MQVESPEKIRNLTLAGHADTGKTTLASALLYTGGVTTRLHRIEDGNAITDFDSQEIERGYSIGLGVCHVPWQKHKINIIDAPGSGLYGVEARAATRAADCMALVVSGVAGVEVMTERMWNYAAEIGQPVLFHANKMDRDNAGLEKVLEAIHHKFGVRAVPIQLPIGKEHGFEGVIDLVDMKAYRYKRDGDGKAAASEIPEALAAEAEEWRGKLIEAVAESAEELMEEYFADGTLPPEDLKKGLRHAILHRDVFPLTLGSAAHGIGNSAFLDAVVAYLPTPLEHAIPATDIGGQPIELAAKPDAPAAALVFKTLNDPFLGKYSLLRVVSGTLSGDGSYLNSRSEATEKLGHTYHMQGKSTTEVPKLITGDIGAVAKLKTTLSGDTLCDAKRPAKIGWIEIRKPAISYAIEPKAKGDEEKIGDALHKMMEEDLGLHLSRDPNTHEFLISGADQLHVEIAIARLKARYKVDVLLHPPKVPYRETIRKTAEGHGRHKKQSGGHGQFADCKIRIEPLPYGQDFEFVDKIYAGAIPLGFRPAVEKGIQEIRHRGFLAGFPVVDFRVSLLDGQYHDVDSSEMAFKIAGSLAFKDAMANAGPTLLEPIMNVEISTSEEYMGDIMGDLSHRRGRPQGMDTKGETLVVKAQVPMAEMLDYAPALRAMTQGRSRFAMEFSGYEEVPRSLQGKIIEAAKAHHKEEEDHH